MVFGGWGVWGPGGGEGGRMDSHSSILNYFTSLLIQWKGQTIDYQSTLEYVGYMVKGINPTSMHSCMVTFST